MDAQQLQSIDWGGVRAVVLDMDGTLLDTEQVIVQAASQVLQHLGHAALPAHYRLPNMFGIAGELMADVLHARGLPLPSGGMPQAGALFEQFYARQPAALAPLYPGVKTWLQAAQARGVALGVCTNKQQALAVKGLQACGILGCFGAVTGRDTCDVGKPAPQPLLHTLAQLQVPPQAAVFVGDTHADAACAQAAGVPFAWFSSGFGTPLVQRYPQALAFADYAELPLPGCAVAA